MSDPRKRAESRGFLKAILPPLQKVPSSSWVFSGRHSEFRYGSEGQIPSAMDFFRTADLLGRCCFGCRAVPNTAPGDPTQGFAVVAHLRLILNTEHLRASARPFEVARFVEESGIDVPLVVIGEGSNVDFLWDVPVGTERLSELSPEECRSLLDRLSKEYAKEQAENFPSAYGKVHVSPTPLIGVPGLENQGNRLTEIPSIPGIKLLWPTVDQRPEDRAECTTGREA